MNILLTNDDGVFSAGIAAVKNSLSSHNVFVLAPESQCSGFSHCISFGKALYPKRIDENVFSLNGTPCDCVKLAVDCLFKPDLVISGINSGINSGTDVWYSGTVQAAFEGYISGVPSIALSSKRSKDGDYSFATSYFAENLDYFYEFAKKAGVINVNFPVFSRENCMGIKTVPVGKRSYDNDFSRTNDGGYSLAGTPIDVDIDKECDLKYLAHGYITVTPLTLDCTDYSLLGGKI